MNLMDKFTESKQISLYKVNFEYWGKLHDQVNLFSKDHIEALEVDDRSLTVLVKRTLDFEPKNIFSASVSYIVIHELKEEFVGKVNWEDIDLEKEIESHLDYYAKDEFDRLSLLLSQITSSFGASPIITPPISNFQEINSDN